MLTATTGDTVTHYIYGIGLLYQEQDGEMLFYHFNNIGSTEAVTDLDGNIVETFAYGPYGELLSENKCGILYLYNGEYGVATDENGLYYMRARYYNSEIKRFINQDVLIGTISDSPTMNRYAYVNGNPISLADPFGLCPTVDWRGMGHFVLGALSLLTLIPTPVTMAIGAAASIANAAWYFHDGQTFEGICSLLCVLPVFGPTMGKIGMVAVGFMNIGKMNYDNWNRYVIGDEIYSWDQAKRDILTGTLSIASVYGGAKGLGWDDVEIPTKVKGCIDLDSSAPVYGDLNKTQKPNRYNNIPWYENEVSEGVRSKSKNKIHPHTGATEGHAVYKVDGETGTITNYKIYKSNPQNPSGFDEVIGYDAVGKAHYNKVTGELLLPHVHDPSSPGKVRKPFFDEIP